LESKPRLRLPEASVECRCGVVLYDVVDRLVEETGEGERLRPNRPCFLGCSW
jgi:hypothetical protein